MDREEGNDCVKFLQDLKAKKKHYAAFESSLKTLQSYAAGEGLLDREIDLLADVIMNSDLGAVKSVSLVKCLVPRRKFKRSTVKSIVTWWLASVDHLPLTVSTIVIQWIVGVLDQQLACRRTVNLFYSVFFHVMLKKEKLERQLARLVYGITKPEDVTRRGVIRLLNLQRKYSKQRNHITALLSLYKSYKPELVPEKIQSVNIESAWKPIPEQLRLMLLQAKARSDLPFDDPSQGDSFKWNTFGPAKAKKNSVPLLPSVAYFQIGSGLFEQDSKSIFDIFSLEDLGKAQLKVQLPCNAVSLMLNHAGYHLLAFADFDYQSRFSYNLYNTLIRAFILEPEKCSTKDAASLLDLTAEFSRYAQQGVPVVARFLDEYLYLNPGGKHQSKLLALLPWITSVSSTDLQRMLTHLRNIFVESSLPSKIEIIRTLKDLVTNLVTFVNEGEESAALFLRQHARMENFEETIEIVARLAENLIVFGLTVHSLNLLLLAEALSFYEAISILESRSNVSFFTLTPAAVIYCCLITKNCAILSRVCKLLLRYRKRGLRKSCKLLCMNKIQAYAEDIVAALWYDGAFKTRIGDPYFLCKVTQRVQNDLKPCNLDRLLNVSNHYAVLPYKLLLREMGFEVNTKEDTMMLALHYYPTIHRFLSVFRG